MELFNQELVDDEVDCEQFDLEPKRMTDTCITHVKPVSAEQATLPPPRHKDVFSTLNPLVHKAFTPKQSTLQSSMTSSNLQLKSTLTQVTSSHVDDTWCDSFCADQLSEADDSISCVGTKHLRSLDAAAVTSLARTTPSATSAQASTNSHNITKRKTMVTSNFEPVTSSLRRTNSAGSDSTDLILGDADQFMTSHFSSQQQLQVNIPSKSTAKEHSVSLQTLPSYSAKLAPSPLPPKENVKTQSRHMTSSQPRAGQLHRSGKFLSFQCINLA